MSIASAEHLNKLRNAQLLPSSWYTLSVLQQMDSSTFQAAVSAGKIHPEMTRADAEALLPPKPLAALAAYARQAKDTDMITWATELKVRAERRAGELLKTMPKNVGANGSKFTGSKKEPVKDLTPTLKQQGISKKDSMRWQQLAAVPEEQFEAAIATRKSIGGSLSTAALLSEIPRLRRAPDGLTCDRQVHPMRARCYTALRSSGCSLALASRRCPNSLAIFINSPSWFRTQNS